MCAKGMIDELLFFNPLFAGNGSKSNVDARAA